MLQRPLGQNDSLTVRSTYLQVETKEPKGLFVAKNADDIRPGMVDSRIESVEIPKSVLVLAAKLKMKYDLAISALMTRYVE